MPPSITKEVFRQLEEAKKRQAQKSKAHRQNNNGEAKNPFDKNYDIEEVLLATSSFRKVLLAKLLFIILNGEEEPEFLSNLYDKKDNFNAYGFINLICSIPNGDNANPKAIFLGRLGRNGPIFRAIPNFGEQGSVAADDEAKNKALAVVENRARRKLAKTSKMIVMGVDSTSRVEYKDEDGNRVVHAVGSKPRNNPDYPRNGTEEERKKYRLKNVTELFSAGEYVSSGTAGVIVSLDGETLAQGEARLEALVNFEELQRQMESLDDGAALWAAFQYFLYQEVLGQPGMFKRSISRIDGGKEYWKKILSHPELKKHIDFFVLAGIMGVPVTLILELLDQASGKLHTNKNKGTAEQTAVEFQHVSAVS